jgi:nicotinamide riboside transporter PnuC
MAEPVKPVDAKENRGTRFYYFISDIQGLFLILALVGAFLIGTGYKSDPVNLVYAISGYVCVVLGVVAIAVLAYFDIRHRSLVSK